MRSELIARVFADDPDELMPPVESNKTLTEDEKPGPPYRLDLNPASRDIAGASIDAMFNDIRHCQTQGDIPEDSWPGGSVVFQLWIRGEKAPQGVSLTPEHLGAVRSRPCCTRLCGPI